MSILLPLISSKKLINQSNFLINSNQSNYSIIDKYSFNHMKVFNFNQSTLLRCKNNYFYLIKRQKTYIKINHNKNQKNKQIYSSNLIIQLRNYS